MVGWIKAKQTKLRRAYLKRPKPMPAHGWAKPYADSVRSIGRAAIAEKKLAELQALAKNNLKLRLLSADEQSELWRKILVLQDYLKLNAFTAPVKHVLWQSDRRQGLEEFNKVKIVAGRFRTLFMYWSGNKFFFIEQDLTLCEIRCSVVYGSRERAMTAHRLGDITWMDDGYLEQLLAL